MTDRLCWTPRVLSAAAALGLAWASAAARAQDIEVEEDAAPQPEQGVFVMNDMQFDQWVYGGVNDSAARRRFDSLLTLKIEDVDRTCGMTEDQKKKLRLAGRGDVKRFFDRVEEKRRKFQNLKTDPNKVGEIFQEIQPFRQTISSGVFGEGSFFAKTLRNTLTGEQAARYEKVVRDAQKFQYRARVDLVVTTLGNAAGLSADQRRRFKTLLLEETRPPKKFGQYDYYVVLIQASKLPQAKVRQIFDDAQWRVLSRQFLQVRGMERTLKNSGVLPDDEEPARPVGGVEHEHRFIQ
jgi:hypothetical protein